ncbi:MAG: hypothetical protein CM1200mP15_03310 [Dehalococcoidia bacterium]|nr:MAG: hypothetical protein CM1200mP15_03310 [Dehalococcoidia bacterium]
MLAMFIGRLGPLTLALLWFPVNNLISFCSGTGYNRLVEAVMKKQGCVVGMGRFGATVSRELYQSGHDVLALDNSDTKIQEMLGQVTYAVTADATNESVLRELGVDEFDVGIVALGSENIQASILITVLLKSLRIPFIVSRAADQLHGDTLERVGADKVVYPEMESATRVAHIDFNSGVLDHMALAPGTGNKQSHTTRRIS